MDAQEMERLARKVWGEPTGRDYNGRELRFGTHGSKSVGLDKLVWSDYEAGRHGGYRELAELAGEPWQPNGQARNDIEATYDYRDERGIMLFQVVRKLGKKFFQRRPDRSSPSGWAWDLKGVRRVPYRLPALHSADPAQPVFIAEGERDCDNLAGLGLIATCNPGGAGKWRHEFGEHFKGRSVVLLPDNDQPGRDHVADVRKKLAKVAGSIRLLALPDLPEKGDVSDWLAKGGNADALKAIVEATPPLLAEEEPSSADLDETIIDLSKLRPLDYERARKQAAKQMGVRAATLDKFVEETREEAGIRSRSRGRALILQIPKPWPREVDGSHLCSALQRFFNWHAKLPTGAEVLLPLWAIHTYVHELWRYTPRLHVTGPTKRCGKSRVLRLLQLVVCKPLASSSISAAATFRSIESIRPCLLIDEADLSVKGRPELLEVLNGGYERGQFAVRTVEPDHEPRMFDLFAPVALAGIGSLADQLEDRSIRLRMCRALMSERTAKITDETEARGRQLARMTVRWVADHRGELEAAHPDISSLPDRIGDHWTPLLAIAAVVGGDWPADARKALAALSPRDDDAPDDLRERLVRDIWKVWPVGIMGPMPEAASAELVAELVAVEGAPWPELGEAQRPLTPNKLASLLQPFGVRPRKIGPKDARRNGYTYQAFSEVYERYELATPKINPL